MTKNIIFVNRFFYPDHSATSQLLSDLAFHLADMGYNVAVICSRQNYDNSNSVLPIKERIFGVNIYRIRTTNFGRYWLPGRAIDYIGYFFGMSHVLFSLLRKNDIVVTKTDPPLASVFTLMIAKIRQAKQVNWIQDLFPEVIIAIDPRSVPKILLSILVKLRNWSFRNSDIVVTIGDMMKKKLQEQGIPESKICMIPNWSDSKNILPVNRVKNPLRNLWELDDKFIVGYSGNMGRVHEFDTIVNAAKRIQKYQEIVFVFIGDGPKKKSIVKRIQELGISNIKFFPYQSYKNLSNSLSLPDFHLVSLLPSIEGLCVPSKYYGIIAAGRGVIFVGERYGEISNIVKSDKTGFQVNCGDDEQLANYIVDLYENPNRLSEIASNAKKSFISKYDKNLAMNKWVSIIDVLATT